MCGISGFVGPGWEVEKLHAMVAAQQHRGPDACGIHVSDDGLVGLGHNRLSIIDPSEAGRQPMTNRDRTIHLVFNGEIYNYRELREVLSDYPYRSRTDTEVLLAAYERWGMSCVDHFVGMFAFALWDERRRRLFCARDRLGIKPFHYTRVGDSFVFASEIKALIAAGYRATPNRQTWATYLIHGYYDHGVDTFFDGISSLAPGHALVVEEGRVSTWCYWDLPQLANEPLRLSDDEAALRLRHLLDDAVRLRLRSDVPLGVNLSGGLDSASLMVTVDGLLDPESEVQTFTAAFEDPRYDETEFASAVPRKSSWARRVQRLKASEAWELCRSAAWHQEAPFGGLATLAYHNLHRFALEERVTVLLEGQGVDEMLAGYSYFIPHYHLDLLEQGRWLELRRELRASAAPSQAIDLVRRLRTYGNLNVYQDGTSHLRPMCVSPDLHALVTEVPIFPTPFKDRLTNTLYRDLRFTKLPRVLRMNDRLSMAFSRELREPYLDHRIVEFLFRLPPEQKLRMGRGKFLLRHAMAGRLPDDLRLADKRGVVTPQREWLRTEQRSRVDDILSSSSFEGRGLFDAAAVREEYRKFCSEERGNSFFVWQWINTEIWFQTFIDGGASFARRTPSVRDLERHAV